EIGRQPTDHATLPAEVRQQPASSGAGRTPVEGDWVVNVASSSQEDPIRAMQADLLKRDIRTELLRLEAGGKPRYRLRVTGFASSGEAKRYAESLAEKANIKGAWAGRR
ncbi:MAG: SPOR domain-containing protein, partial [Thiohalobacterales bacterium]|nr:SPOR domain-containing protein [Thiohalobacterales bacterium]